MNWISSLFGREKRPAVTGPNPIDNGSVRHEFPLASPVAIVRVAGIAAVAREPRRKGALVRIDYYAGDGERVPGPYPGLEHSKRHGPHLFVPTTSKGDAFVHYLTPPATAGSVVLTFRQWLANPFRLSNLTVETLDPIATWTESEAIADPKILRVLSRVMLRTGEISAARRLARLTYARSHGFADKHRLDMLNGNLRELDQGWSPSIPAILKFSLPPKPTTVCHLFKVTYPQESSGGAIRGLNLVSSLKEVGYESIVVTPLLYPKGGTKQRRETIDGVVYYNLGLPGGAAPDAPLDRQLQYDALLTASIVVREAPAIIHAASGYRGYELALKALPIGRRFGLPVIYEVRSFHEHLWGKHRGLDCEWTKLRVGQENRCMSCADAVVTISHAMREALVRRGVDERRLFVVPNAVGDEFLQAAPPASPDLRRSLGFGDAPIIGYVSNLSEREGHEVLLGAVAQLRSTGRDVRCLIVGGGPRLRELKLLSKRLGIAAQTVFTGEIDHSEVRGYYEAIDIFVVPRLADLAADYVTPLKPFEALALERPLVMSDRPVASEIIGNEERGLLFRTGDPAHLASVLERLLDNPDSGCEMARRGRRWVENERTWKKNALQYRDIYSETLARFGSTTGPA